MQLKQSTNPLAWINVANGNVGGARMLSNEPGSTRVHMQATKWPRNRPDVITAK